MLTEKELYTGCANYDDTVRKQVFEQFLPAMHAICARYCACADDADDLVQEGFIKVFTKIDSFEWKGNGSFAGWIKIIFVNTAINAYKKKASSLIDNYEDMAEEDPRLMDDEEADSMLAEAMDTFSYEYIMDCVGRLPDQFRVVFNLFLIEGLSHKEIAQLLDIPLKTSTTRYLRAREKLRVMLMSKMVNKMELQY